ncbi:MAG TPA: bacteriohopanetetrol glucosamine biosynthesis glycosyltransferase HpnI [Blastocatellia bacterium]
MKTFLLLSSLILCSSLGEILSAKGMQQIGDVSFRPRALLGAFWRMLRNQYLFFGVVFMAASFFSFISLLSYADLSFVVPLTAVGYITNTLGARFFLHERISRERWLGTLLVACGVSLISLSGKLEAAIRANWTNWLDWVYSAFAPAWIESPTWFRLLFGIRLTLFALALAAIVYSAFSLLGALAWFVDRRKQRALGLGFTPPATILKPVRGADAEAYENFASFCRQDYPDYQIVFGVREETDPAVPVIRRLMADFPALPIELVISADEIGYNAKVSNLQNIFAKAKHDTLLIVDSDIRVEPDYLRRVIAPMQQERVGMVTCLYRGVKARSFAALLENIGISSTFGPEVCSARLLEGVAFAFGSTIVLRRELLERIGGFPAVADYLADDFLLGNFTANAGYEVVLSDCVVEHIAGDVTFGEMLKHQLRWAQAKRLSRPWGYRGLILTYGTATSLLALITWGFSGFAWWLFAITLLVRFLPVFIVGVLGLKDQALARYCWLVPVRDLITFGIWVASFFDDEIHWRGISFCVLPGGKLTPTRRNS